MGLVSCSFWSCQVCLLCVSEHAWRKAGEVRLHADFLLPVSAFLPAISVSPPWIHLPSRPQLPCVYRLLILVACQKPYGNSHSQRWILGGRSLSTFCLWIQIFKAMNEIILVYAIQNFFLRASVCLFQVQCSRAALKPAGSSSLPGDLCVSSLVSYVLRVNQRRSISLWQSQSKYTRLIIA